MFDFRNTRNRLGKAIALVSASCMLAQALTGCGGGGAAGNPGSVSSAGMGTITMTVKWPARTRIIPSEANEIIVTAYAPGTATPTGNSTPTGNTVRAVQTATITRASNSPSTSTVQIQNLPPTAIGITTSAYLLQIEAYNSEGGHAGSPLAYAFTNATVTAGQNTVVNVTLASTLARLKISGVQSRAIPASGNNAAVPAGADFDVDLNGHLTVDATGAQYPSSSIPLDASTPGFFTAVITPEDAAGDVLLLAPQGASGVTSTAIFSATGGSGGAIALQTPSAGTTALPSGQFTPTFGLESTGTEGGDSFSITYIDDGTTVSFPVPVTVSADAVPSVTLTLNNPPPQFDGPSPTSVSATATITEVTANNAPTTFTYSGTPTYGTATVTFTFANVKNHQRGFIYSYALNGLTTGGAAVPFKVGGVTVGTTSAFPTAPPPATVPSVGVRNASSDPMLLTSFTGSANTVTLTRLSPPPAATNIPVTAVFGTVSGIFPANLFKVGAGTDTTVAPTNPPLPFNALLFSQYVTQAAPGGYPSTSMSSLTPIWSLDYFARTATLPLGMLDRNASGAPISLTVTGTYTVNVPASAGGLGGSGG